jgi:integrase
LPVIPRAEQLTCDDAARDVINDFMTNKKRSLVMARRRIDKHLTPFFGGRRLTGVTATDIRAYVAKRQAEVVVLRRERTSDGEVVPAVTKPTANATINRELQMLKRIFSLAIQGGRLASKPHIPMLKESAARSGFFDRAQVEAVVQHLPDAIRPVIRFAFITGWRLHSEILRLEWRQVDFAAGQLRLDPGATKNEQPRTFPMTAELRRLLEERKAEHSALKKAGHITPFVFWRMVAEGRGGEKKPRQIVAFAKAWRKACVEAGCPGRIPHDLRRSAVRTFVRTGDGGFLKPYAKRGCRAVAPIFTPNLYRLARLAIASCQKHRAIRWRKAAVIRPAGAITPPARDRGARSEGTSEEWRACLAVARPAQRGGRRREQAVDILRQSRRHSTSLEVERRVDGPGQHIDVS